MRLERFGAYFVERGEDHEIEYSRYDSEDRPHGDEFAYIVLFRFAKFFGSYGVGRDGNGGEVREQVDEEYLEREHREKVDEKRGDGNGIKITEV